jgi:hypothetical protein
MLHPLKPIWELPIVGDLLYRIFWVTGWCLMCPISAILGGCQRLKFGTSVVWVTRQKSQVVQDGVELLQKRDPEMFSRFMGKQRLIIYYIPNRGTDRKANYRAFLMYDTFVNLGAEGVACFIVQSLMVSAAVGRVNPHRMDEQQNAALKSVSRNMMEWLSKNSFDAGLINAYQKVVERQAQAALGP